MSWRPRAISSSARTAPICISIRTCCPPGWRQARQWVHVGGISLACEPLAACLPGLAGQLKAAGVRISYDPNFRRPPMDAAAYAPMLERLCRLADLIKVSDEDLRGLFPDARPESGLARIRARNSRALLLHSRGAAGARLILPDGQRQAASPTIALVDSVGAGDARDRGHAGQPDAEASGGASAAPGLGRGRRRRGLHARQRECAIARGAGGRRQAAYTAAARSEAVVQPQDLTQGKALAGAAPAVDAETGGGAGMA